MTERDRLAADLHEHWLEDAYISDGQIFAPCTCGDHVPVPAVTIENRDPVMAFSEHVADRLIALGWTRCGCEGCGDSIKGEAWHYSCAASTLGREDFVESIGLSCCPHTEPASLREHVENEGSCIVCREYVAHTDGGYRLVAWPCPTVRAATLGEERLARALVVPLFDLFGFDERLSDDALVILAAAIAKAYREDTG